MNSFILKRNLYKVSKDLFDITKGLEHLGYINDDARAETALKTYLYNTNAVNLSHTQYLIMLGIAKNCWYFKSLNNDGPILTIKTSLFTII